MIVNQGELSFAAYSLPPEREGSIFKPRFTASTSAFLKFNAGKILLVGQANAPSAGLEFRPEGFSAALRLPVGVQAALMDEPASELANAVRTILLGDPQARDGGLQIRDLRLELARLVARKRAHDPGFALFERLAQRMLAWPPETVGALAEMSGYSSRQLQRIFLRYAGLAPKEFLEVLRFERSLAEPPSEDSRASPAHTGKNLDYYDQSHRIRDYRRFSGLTPGQIRRALSDPYNTEGRFPFILGEK